MKEKTNYTNNFNNELFTNILFTKFKKQKNKKQKNPVTIEEVSKAALIIFVITPDISVYAISKFVYIYMSSSLSTINLFHRY